MKKFLIPLLFVLAAAANLAGQLLQNDPLASTSKILLMPLLIIWVLSRRLPERHLSFLLPLALVFSWLGDIFLIFDHLFIAGLASFLVTQILYSVIFYQSVKGQLHQPFLRMIPYIFYGAAFFYVILPEAGNLKVAIIVYGVSLLSMGFLSLTRQGNSSTISFVLVVAGSTFFIFSDSLIAAGMFLNKLPNHSFWVMSGYTAAQLLIVSGLISDQST